MPANQFMPEDDARRPSARPTPNLTGDEPGLSRVRAALQRRGPKGAAVAPLAQPGAPASNTHIGPTVAYGTSVRSRAASPTTSTEGVTVMRRLTRTIRHLIAGSLASQRVARANAATAGVTLEARREEREGVHAAHLEAHHATLAQAAVRHSSAETMLPLGLAAEVAPRLPGPDLRKVVVLRPADQNDSQGSVRVPSPHVAPTIGTAIEVDPEPQAPGAAVVAEAVAPALEGAR